MFEQMEEVLSPVGVVINQRIVRQVKIASTGHSGKSRAEYIEFIFGLGDYLSRWVPSAYLSI